MTGPIAELVGWLLSLGLLSLTVGLLLFNLRRKPTPPESIPWREVIAIVLALAALGLLSFLLPYAGRAFFDSPDPPSLLLDL